MGAAAPAAPYIAMTVLTAAGMYQQHQAQKEQQKALDKQAAVVPPTPTPPPSASTSLTPDSGVALRKRLQGMRYGLASTMTSNPMTESNPPAMSNLMGGRPLQTKVGA